MLGAPSGCHLLQLLLGFFDFLTLFSDFFLSPLKFALQPFHLGLIPFLLCQCLAEQLEDLLDISLVNPGNFRKLLMVIERTLLSTHRTCLANTLIGSGMNIYMIMLLWFTVHNSLIGHIFNVINMHALDVKSLHH